MQLVFVKMWLIGRYLGDKSIIMCSKNSFQYFINISKKKIENQLLGIMTHALGIKYG